MRSRATWPRKWSAISPNGFRDPPPRAHGHFYNIGTKPAYRQFMVPDGGTVDIRQPKAVEFVLHLVDELCEAFPGKFLNVDITEINDAAFKQSGTTQQELTELTLQIGCPNPTCATSPSPKNVS